MLFREMTGADHMAAAERAYDRDEARLQRSQDRDPADDDYYFDDMDDPVDESLGMWVDERIRMYAENLSADELYDPALRELGEVA
jgi:hypothetical protein